VAVGWDALGAIAELIGAVAVVASLVYLARQIRQNSHFVEQSAAATRAQAAVVSAGHGAAAFRALASDAELTRIWFTGIAAAGELTENELRRFDLLLMAQIIEIDANYDLARAGVLAPEIWAIWDGILERWAQHPRFLQIWNGGNLPRFVTASLAEKVREKLAARAG
jgi:hypothetical protein